MGCCCNDNENTDYSYTGANNTRKNSFTDIIPLTVFIIFIAGFGFITYYNFQSGAIYGTWHGYDSYGNACGFDNSKLSPPGQNNLKKTERFCFNYDNIVGTILETKDQLTSACICVEKCPSEKEINSINKFIKYEESSNSSFCKDFPEQVERTKSNFKNMGPCPEITKNSNNQDIYLQNTINIMHRCIPVASINAVEFLTKMVTELDYIQNIIMSIYNAKSEIITACIFAVILSFIIVLAMGYIANVISIIIGVGSILIMLALATLFWMLKFNPSLFNNLTNEIITNKDVSSDLTTYVSNMDQRLVLACAIATSSIAIILICFMAFIRSRQQVAVGLLKESSKLICQLPYMLLIPITTMVILILYWTAWSYLFLVVYTSKINSTVTNSGIVLMKVSPYVKYFKWYILFSVFWISEFIIACHYMVIAGTTQKWFFRNSVKTTCSLIEATSNLIIYHLGSAALGSLLIALVQIPRAILMYIDAKLKQSNQENPLVKFIMCCLHSCLACVECCLRYISKNAYILVMLNSTNFCKSACQGIELLGGNALQVLAIQGVSFFTTLLARIFISSLSAFYVAIIIYWKIDKVVEFQKLVNDWLKLPDSNNGISKEISENIIPYRAVPIIVTLIVCYFISKVFLGLYDMISQTMLVCFCYDLKIHTGDDGDNYEMPASLKKFVEDSSNEILTIDRRNRNK